MKDTLRVLNTFTGFEPEAMRKYFTRMAEKGYMLTDTDDYHFIFTKQPPRKTNWFVDFAEVNSPMRYTDFASDAGWRFVCHNGFAYIFINDDLNAVPMRTEITPDGNRRIQLLARKILLPNLYAFLVLCFVVLMSIFGDFAEPVLSDITIAISTIALSMLVPCLISVLNAALCLMRMTQAKRRGASMPDYRGRWALPLKLIIILAVSVSLAAFGNLYPLLFTVWIALAAAFWVYSREKKPGDRAEQAPCIRRAAVIVGGILLLALFVVGNFAIHGIEQSNSPKYADMVAAKDFPGVSENDFEVYQTTTTTIAGEQIQCVCYFKENPNEYDNIDLRVYSFPNAWLHNRLLKSRLKNGDIHTITADGEKSAYYNAARGLYVIDFGDRVVTISSTLSLDDNTLALLSARAYEAGKSKIGSKMCCN